MAERFDHLILGGGRRGLAAALALATTRPDASLLVVESEPRPGGSLRTQRSNGFVCELGAFALAAEDCEPLLGSLARAPRPIRAATDSGAVFDGTGQRLVALDRQPMSFQSGCEELAQACRLELGNRLRLGRSVSRLEPRDDGWLVELDGEVPTPLLAGEVTVALPVPEAARLLGGLDPALTDTADRLIVEPRAFVFLGGLARDCAALSGYGIVAAETAASPLLEVIYCSNVFPGRDLGDRFLLRCELAEPSADEHAAIATARAELRRWTDFDGEFGFTKVHRFDAALRDATWAECRARFDGAAARASNLHVV